MNWKRIDQVLGIVALVMSIVAIILGHIDWATLFTAQYCMLKMVDDE